jgi:CDP-glucose 4,6-dehydratase
MSIDPHFWQGKRVLLTGHTGFKGGWLALWLQQMGAQVHGLSLAPPTQPNLFEQARVAEGLASSTLGDIRDFAVVRDAMARSQAEVVLHLAAQPLVRLSYREPVETYATNVMGTVHVLEAARQVGGVRAIVNVTTDKCYENREWAWGYRENEAMGGHDPYSSSKGCAELVTAAYRQSFMKEAGVALASARAGNVIGGGDWSEDRLIPDILKAFQRNEAVVVRNPHATRPWQHVLEPLSGYLCLAQRLHGHGQDLAEGWNFGPKDEDARPVRWIVEHLVKTWGPGASWQLDPQAHPHEASNLKLDISKAQHRLGWRPQWDLATALQHTVDWHRAWMKQDDMRQFTLQQIQHYVHSLPSERAPT